MHIVMLPKPPGGQLESGPGKSSQRRWTLLVGAASLFERSCANSLTVKVLTAAESPSSIFKLRASNHLHQHLHVRKQWGIFKSNMFKKCLIILGLSCNDSANSLVIFSCNHLRKRYLTGDFSWLLFKGNLLLSFSEDRCLPFIVFHVFKTKKVHSSEKADLKPAFRIYCTCNLLCKSVFLKREVSEVRTSNWFEVSLALWSWDPLFGEQGHCSFRQHVEVIAPSGCAELEGGGW